MLYISYENDIGKLNLGGGDMSSYAWKVLSIEGIGLPDKTLNSAQYPMAVGQRTISETVGARTITIQCDVHSQSGNEYEIPRALKILNEPGVILIHTESKTRKIDARCVSATPGEQHGGYRIFVLQFLCDYPYFEDQRQTTVSIFRREELIGSGMKLTKEGESPIEQGTFALPCIFSRRITEANVLNIGDIDTEPIITIKLQGETYKSDDAGPLILKNNTTGQTLELNCDPTTISTITLNIPNRTIQNQKGENLIANLSSNSFLSNFWLAKGSNFISAENHMSNSSSVECAFSNKYVEAVIV